MNGSDEDVIQRIIACSRKQEIDNKSAWVERHRAQADDDFDIDETDIDGTDAVCAVYEPGVDIDIHATDDEYRKTLRDRLFQRSIAGVEIPVRTGCDRVFGEETELPIYDGNLEGAIGTPYQSAYATVCLTPLEMLQVQYQIGTVNNPEPATFEEWLPELSDQRLQTFQDKLQQDPETLERPVPRPVLAFDHDGDVSTAQEGRHRAAAAFNLGLGLIDVYVMVHHQVTTSEPEWAFDEPPELPSKWG